MMWVAPSTLLIIIIAGSCSDPTVPKNGLKSGTDYSLGAMVTFSCNEGYSVAGASTISCVGSGSSVMWSETIPTCQGT